MRRTSITSLPDSAAGDDPEDDRDAGPGDGPLRRCAVTREQGERARMLRFVVGPEGQVVADLRAMLPGRGIWLSARRDVLETARRRGAFARAAKCPVIVPDDLAARVEAGLVRRVTELLGLARRAGQAVCGFQRAREWLQSGRRGLVVQASDGSSEERSRFLSGMQGVPVAAPLTGVALGGVFGRDHVVHVVVAEGRLATGLTIEAGRLAGIAGRPGDGIADRQDPAARMRQPAGGSGERLDGTGGR